MWSWRSESQSRGYIASFGKLHDDRRQAGAGVQSAHSSSGELWLRDLEVERQSTPRKQTVTFESVATRRRVTAGSKPTNLVARAAPTACPSDLSRACDEEGDAEVAELARGIVTEGQDGSTGLGSGVRCRATITVAAYRQLSWPNRASVE